MNAIQTIRRRAVPCAWLLVTTAVACGGPARPEPPGHSESIPSAVAQAVLRELEGRPFPDPDGLLHEAAWQVGPFAVIPNPVTGKGPVVSVQTADAGAMSYGGAADDPNRWFVPVVTDGDVAALFERVTGGAHPDLRGETSSAFRDAFAGAPEQAALRRQGR